MFLEIIYPVSVIIIGLTFIIGSTKSKSDTPVLAKKAFFLSGLFAITCGILVIIMNNQIVPLNVIAKRLIEQLRTFIGGMAVGILITLFLSGDISFIKKRKAIKDGGGRD